MRDGCAYYNENDRFMAQWLRNLIRDGLIAPGDVDERSIADVRAGDLRGYAQCHFFAGLGGWSAALRAAGWPDDRPVWSGSCPCQPFSAAGRRAGFADERHLWPVWRELIRSADDALGPVAAIFGEQVASAVDWLRLVRGDLEAQGRAVGCVPVEAASAGAFHLRDRWFFVADSDGGREPRRSDEEGAAQICGEAQAQGQDGQRLRLFDQRARDGYDQVIGADGKTRLVEPGIRLLAHGVSGRVAVRRAVEQAGATIEEEHRYSRVGALKGFGNAIDLRPSTAFIRAYMQC